jgi:hypothetical protein
MKKNMIKKLWSVILSVMLIAAMSMCAVGCGNTAEAPAADSDNTQAEEVVAEDDKDAADETEAKDADAEDADAAESDAEEESGVTEDMIGVEVVYTTEAIVDGAEYGEGEKSFTLEVTDADENVVSCVINTDATTVGEALCDLGLIDGDDSEYGLYVKSVNNMTYNYETDGKYWAFDDTDVTDGSTYAFKAE